MKKFTISQEQKGLNLFLYPNVDLCTDFDPVGDSPNFACVDDDRLVPDDDTTYVTWSQITEGFDLYELPDHDTESGTINYVQVYARAKSHQTAQSPTGIFKILCSPDGACTDDYESSDINLVTGYSTYSNIWTENPQTVADWTWDDIDLLCIGEKCDSPTVSGAARSLTLRPNAVGDVTQLTGTQPINWYNVDEANPNCPPGGNYVWGDNWDYDLYNLQNHTTQVGVIQNVTVYICCFSMAIGGLDNFKEKIKTGGVEFTGTISHQPNVFCCELFSYSWPINPQTIVAWTWADIDALQAGVAIDSAGDEGKCTQVYVVVDYLEDINPEIRTTQCYAKVNYDAPDKVCWLSNPKTISKDHARNVKKLNFWSGEREVYDLNRNGKSVVMEGTERTNPWCEMDYSYRKKIYINHDEVDENLTSFPVLINITDSDLTNHSESTNGYDIIFRDMACQPLLHELESYTTDGHLVAWVRVPHVDCETDTLVQMYYGNSNITTDLSSCYTWADYAYVFHMNDNPDNAHISDASCRYHAGFKTGANEPIENNDGRILECQVFDGVNDDIYVPDPSCGCPLCFPICFPACFDCSTNPNNNFTISLWASHATDVTDGYGAILDKCSFWNDRHYLIDWENDDDIYFVVRDTADRTAGFTRFSGDYNNQWVHILAIADSDNTGEVRIYVNGELGTLVDDIEGALLTNTATLKIGRLGYNAGVSDYRFNGSLDEIRLRCEAVPYPEAWAKAEYRNINSLPSFLDVQEEEDITTPCLRIQCVRDMGRAGVDVNITDLGFTTFNSTYQIRSFGWKEVSQEPSMFDWIIELERST